MPTKAELRAYYEHKAETLNELALTYENTNPYKRFFYRARSDAILAALAPLNPGEFVLDVGAGSGYYGQQMSAAGANAVLMDLSRTVLEQARAAGTNAVGYVCCDASAMPFAPKSFDKVLCTEVLEHLPDAPQALLECARVMQDDGELVVTTPSRWSPMNLAYGIKRKVRGYEFNEHLTEYTIAGFKDLVKQSFVLQALNFANFLVPYPFDQFLITAQSSRLIGALKWIEETLARTPGLRRLGWTMIATCKKKASMTS